MYAPGRYSTKASPKVVQEFAKFVKVLSEISCSTETQLSCSALALLLSL